MKTKEIFALLLRVIGVVGLIYVGRNAVNQCTHGSFPTDALYWIMRVIYVVLGAYLVRGAPQIVKFAFPEEAEEAREAKRA